MQQAMHMLWPPQDASDRTPPPPTLRNASGGFQCSPDVLPGCSVCHQCVMPPGHPQSQRTRFWGCMLAGSLADCWVGAPRRPGHKGQQKTPTVTRHMCRAKPYQLAAGQAAGAAAHNVPVCCMRQETIIPRAMASLLVGHHRRLRQGCHNATQALLIDCVTGRTTQQLPCRNTCSAACH